MQEIINGVNASDPDLCFQATQVGRYHQISAIYRFIARNEVKWTIWLFGCGKMPTQYKKRLVYPKNETKYLLYTVLEQLKESQCCQR